MSPSERELLQRLLERVERRYYGKYQGFVVDTADPQKRGRLRALVPEVLGPEVVSGWAEPCFPWGGGADFGTFSVPPVTKRGDAYTTGVWIEFRGGDPQYPIWVGTFFGAPDDASEAPGDDAEPSVDVHVARTFAGHSVVAVDTPQEERLEIRDAAGQRLTFEAPLRENTKRDADGNKATATLDVAYSDLVANEAKITLTDFAGNTVLLDATKSAPTVRITNTDRDGNVVQTIELIGAGSDPRIVITDNNQNVVTMSKDGITIDAQGHGDTIKLDSAGVAVDAPKIDLNQGTMGAARKNDRVESGMMDDPAFWTWVNTLMMWVQTHTHVSPVGPTSPPIPPFPGSIPSKCTGKIIESSGSVVIGD
ncbi:phage baseplate assembly protein V [Sorangium sp. So ce861]|uniref:phage baseplate assembly protein V n=1 Tax=Sorangium sp. So ce861 TaxID=3133323 RepID=UPI003F5FBF86